MCSYGSRLRALLGSTSAPYPTAFALYGSPHARRRLVGTLWALSPDEPPEDPPDGAPDGAPEGAPEAPASVPVPVWVASPEAAPLAVPPVCCGMAGTESAPAPAPVLAPPTVVTDTASAFAAHADRPAGTAVGLPSVTTFVAPLIAAVYVVLVRLPS